MRETLRRSISQVHLRQKMFGPKKFLHLSSHWISALIVYFLSCHINGMQQFWALTYNEDSTILNGRLFWLEPFCKPNACQICQLDRTKKSTSSFKHGCAGRHIKVSGHIRRQNRPKKSLKSFFKVCPKFARKQYFQLLPSLQPTNEPTTWGRC